MSTPRPRPPQKSTVTSYHATLESLTVTGVRENASIRLPLKARETPQSVSVTTRKQMDDESLTSVDAVLRHMTGVMTSLYDTQRPLYYTRGFVIKDFQVDGMPSYSGETNQEYDTALYERVDLVRGANGILTGVGTPSATVNLIRKRPTRESGGTVDISAGRWDYYRAVADVNMPITADGSVRSRFVLAPQKKHSFYKRYEENKLAFLGVVEADLGPATEVSVGYQRQKNAPKAPVWGPSLASTPTARWPTCRFPPASRHPGHAGSAARARHLLRSATRSMTTGRSRPTWTIPPARPTA